MATDITDSQFEAEVLKSSVPVLVDFWAPWCGPCKIMGPVIDELATEYGPQVKFVKINVDENADVAGMFNVMSIPTFILFQGGQPKKAFVGARPKEDMKKEIDGAIAQ